jgi:DNA-binding CsgD family transcriptional regulator
MIGDPTTLRYDQQMVRPFRGIQPHADSALFAGPRGAEELLVAGSDTYARAATLLGTPQDVWEAPSGELRLLDGQLAVVNGLLRDRLVKGQDLPTSQLAAISEALLDVHSVRFSIHDHLGFQRLQRLEALERGIDDLWRVSDQDELLAIACSVAVRSGGFDRVMISRVADGTWRPWRSLARQHGSDERRLRAWLETRPEISLGDRRVAESELVRRREAILVDGSGVSRRMHGPLREASGVTSYVAAPILSGERVIGMVHADYQSGEVSELDREVLGAFARGFGRVLERAMLQSQLVEQRAEVVGAMRTVERMLEAVATARPSLGVEPTVVPDGQSDSPACAVHDPSGLDGVLTGRELEVLALMSTGATNDRIGQELVIATETVKTHVKRILRKLGAENRAEAISTYLRLSMGPRDSAKPHLPKALPYSV